MHTLHTTEAFILDRYEHGDSSYVYKLFTKEKGLLFAHAQGVREMRNKNRYGLRTYAHASVTLVRGREVWRVTSVRAMQNASSDAFCSALRFVGTLLPREVAERELFSDVYSACMYIEQTDMSPKVVESVVVLRALALLGYVDIKKVPIHATDLFLFGIYTDKLCLDVAMQHVQINRFINEALSHV